MSYSELMKKYQVSKARVERFKSESSEKVDKLKQQITDESSRCNSLILKETQLQVSLMREIQQCVSEDTGLDITVSKTYSENSEAKSPKYNRLQIIERIKQLKEERWTFASIAAILNTEGWKPRSAKEFTETVVRQLYYSNAAKTKKFLGMVESS